MTSLSPIINHNSENIIANILDSNLFYSETNYDKNVLLWEFNVYL